MLCPAPLMYTHLNGALDFQSLAAFSTVVVDFNPIDQDIAFLVFHIHLPPSLKLRRARRGGHAAEDPAVSQTGQRFVLGLEIQALELIGQPLRTGWKTLKPFQVPAGLVAPGIELGQRWCTAAYSSQRHRFPGIGHRLGHDAIRAVG